MANYRLVLFYLFTLTVSPPPYCVMAGCIFSVFIWMSFLLLLSYSRKKEIFDWIVAMQTDVSIETVGQDTEES